MSSETTLITANYHTHTAMCHHAHGEMRDYVEAAVKAGLKTLGFSCHAPYSFEGGYVSHFRMAPEETELYVREILSLKDEFEGKIDIKLGYEAEYYPRHFKDFLDRINAFPCDYIILGQHYTDNEYDGHYSGNNFTYGDPKVIKKYVSQVTEAMRLGVFTYLAHPDLSPLTEKVDEYLEIMSEICRASLETDTPLEINLLGIQGGKSYPKDVFWKMVGEFGCPVVIGFDAHGPEGLLDEGTPRKAMEMIEKYSLNYTGNNIPLKRPVL